MTQHWMIYGAKGYSGELIARQAEPSRLFTDRVSLLPHKVCAPCGFGRVCI